MQPIYYWRGAVGDSGFIKDHEVAINKLLQGDYAAGDLEKLAGHEDIYSYRLSLRERLLFTTLKVGDSSYLLLLEYLPTHDYQKSRFLRSGVLKHYIAKEEEGLTQAIALGFEPYHGAIEGLQGVVEEGNKPIAVDYYHRQFIQLNTEQQQALDVSLPAVISGAAGSGKSCLAILLLTEFVSKCQRQGLEMELPILYVSQSKRLVDAMEEHWNELPIANDLVRGLVQFRTYETLLAEHVDLAGMKVVGKGDFEAWYAAYVKHAQLLQRVKLAEKGVDVLDSEDVYQEFRICSVYQEEAYRALGKRQSLFPKEQREWLYGAFQAYQSHLHENHLVHPAFHTIGRDACYGLVVVDESQDLSYLQLKELLSLAKDRAIAYCMDSHQSLSDTRSQRPFLLDLLRLANKDATHIELGMTYRCPMKVVQAANAVIELKHRLTGGIADKKEATAILPNIGQQVGVGHVLVLDEATLLAWPWLQAKVQETSIAVITQAAFREEASQLFKTPLVFTVDEIKGLEYDTVIAYQLFPQAMFKAAYAQLREEGVGVQPQHRAKLGVGDERFGPCFNQIFTSYTRAKQTLLICEKPSREASILLTPLQRIMGVGCCVDVEQSSYQTMPSDWLSEVKQQLQHGNEELALSIYLAKINQNEAAFKSWKASYEAKAEVVKVVDESRFAEGEGSSQEDEASSQGASVSHHDKLMLPNREKNKSKEASLAVAAVMARKEPVLLGKKTMPPRKTEPSKEHGTVQLSLEQEQRILKALLDDFSEKRLLTSVQLIGVERCLFDIRLESSDGCFLPAILHILNSPDKLKQLESYDSFFKILQADPVNQNVLDAFEKLESIVHLSPAQKITMLGMMMLFNPKLLKKSKYMQTWFKTELSVPQIETQEENILHWLIGKSRLFSELLSHYPDMLKDIPIARWGDTCGDGVYKISLLAYAVIAPWGIRIISRLIEDYPEVIEAYPSLWGERQIGGVTPLYWLAINQEANTVIQLMIKRLPHIIAQIPMEGWLSCIRACKVGPNTLCAIASQGPEGAKIFQLLIQRVPAAIEAIPPDAWGMLCESDHNSSALYWLCSSEAGQNVLILLIKKCPKVIEQIPSMAWGEPRTAAAGRYCNVSPLYLLATTSHGNRVIQLLLEKMPQVIKAIPAKAWRLALTRASGVAENTTPLYGIVSLDQGFDTLQGLIEQCPEVLASIPLEVWELQVPHADSAFDKLFKSARGKSFLSEVLNLKESQRNKKSMVDSAAESHNRDALKTHPSVNNSSTTYGLFTPKANRVSERDATGATDPQLESDVEVSSMHK